MNFNISKRYNCVVVELNGNVTGGSDSLALNDKLHELIDQGIKNAVVELGRVQFMNSTGLGMLIGALTTMRNAGGDLRIANATDKIENLLMITELITVLKHYQSLDEAVESFTSKKLID